MIRRLSQTQEVCAGKASRMLPKEQLKSLKHNRRFDSRRVLVAWRLLSMSLSRIELLRRLRYPNIWQEKGLERWVSRRGLKPLPKLYAYQKSCGNSLKRSTG